MTDRATIAEARLLVAMYEGTRAVNAEHGIVPPQVVRHARLAVSLAAVVDALPKCGHSMDSGVHTCGRPAMFRDPFPQFADEYYCDEHIVAPYEELPYAAALRAMETP